MIKFDPLLYSVVSTVIGVILLIVSVGLTVKTWLDSKNKKVQVKIWMQDANGISNALQRVVSDNLEGRYSSTKDMGNTIWSIQAMAFALYQSLYEERCLSEKEFIAEQKEVRAKSKKLLDEDLKLARKNRATNILPQANTTPQVSAPNS